jgi:hypothetical protein
LSGAVFVPRLRNAEYIKIRHPLQWNAATEFDVVRPGNCGRRDDSIGRAECAPGCLIKHGFRVAGYSTATLEFASPSLNPSLGDLA